jgi:hypothetical protein
MKRIKNSKTLTRTAGLIAVALIIIGGVAFALLQSQQNTLTGNTIETGSADLRISTNATTFTTSHTGFDFNSLIPGGPAQPAAGNAFYLQNTGTSSLALKLAVSSVPTNPDNVDLSKVTVVLTTVGSSNAPQSFSLQSLIASAPTGGIALTGSSLPSGMLQQYKLQVALDIDAVHGQNGNIGNLDLAFTGVAVSN